MRIVLGTTPRTVDQHAATELLAFRPGDRSRPAGNGGSPLDLTASQRLARRRHKELDFFREESVHADVVGGLEGIAPTAKAPRLNGGALGGGSAAHGARLPTGGHPNGQISFC